MQFAKKEEKIRTIEFIRIDDSWTNYGTSSGRVKIAGAAWV
jgi:hypothetical protein